MNDLEQALRKEFPNADSFQSRAHHLASCTVGPLLVQLERPTAGNKILVMVGEEVNLEHKFPKEAAAEARTMLSGYLVEFQKQFAK